MECSLREWRMEDAGELARIISPGVLENLRDGIPFPYTQRDGEEFIASMLSADPRRVFAFAITAQWRQYVRETARATMVVIVRLISEPLPKIGADSAMNSE